MTSLYSGVAEWVFFIYNLHLRREAGRTGFQETYVHSPPYSEVLINPSINTQLFSRYLTIICYLWTGIHGVVLKDILLTVAEPPKQNMKSAKLVDCMLGDKGYLGIRQVVCIVSWSYMYRYLAVPRSSIIPYFSRAVSCHILVDQCHGAMSCHVLAEQCHGTVSCYVLVDQCHGTVSCHVLVDQCHVMF